MIGQAERFYSFLFFTFSSPASRKSIEIYLSWPILSAMSVIGLENAEPFDFSKIGGPSLGSFEVG